MTTAAKIHSFDEVFDAQRVFRLILKATANPATTVDIQPYADRLYGRYPQLLAIAMTLLDNEVSFSTCENRALSDEIVSLTLSRREPLDRADFLFVTDAALLEEAVTHAACGTLRDPHRSATLVVWNPGEATDTLRLRGPGIWETMPYEATDVVRTALELRDGQFYEYPQGIDFLFVSDRGGLVAIPRLTRREVR